jgi:hypothetical protein
MRKRIIVTSIAVICICCVIVYFLYGLLPKQQSYGEIGDCCYHAKIYLQPYDNFTQKETNKLKADLDKHLAEILNGAFTVEVLPNKPLSDSFLGETRKKYRIDKLIDDLKGNADKHNIYIGLTHRDICQKLKNGVVDWGVLGSSLSAYNACVASDYRLKNKNRDFWKVVIHEFIHTFYDYPHCPMDSTHCLMKDAKGKANFGNKNDLCGYCKGKIG